MIVYRSVSGDSIFADVDDKHSETHNIHTMKILFCYVYLFSETHFELDYLLTDLHTFNNNNCYFICNIMLYCLYSRVCIYFQYHLIGLIKYSILLVP